jgi:hypothetical protein
MGTNTRSQVPLRIRRLMVSLSGMVPSKYASSTCRHTRDGVRCRSVERRALCVRARAHV